MANYVLIYKCRLCGGEHNREVPSSSKLGIIQLLEDVWEKAPMDAHACADGIVGIADFHGVKMGEDAGVVIPVQPDPKHARVERVEVAHD